MFEFLNTWLTNGGFWVAIPLIVLGCVALIKGAGWLVDGASGLAKKYGIETAEAEYSAKKKCPNLAICDAHHDKYAE